MDNASALPFRRLRMQAAAAESPVASGFSLLGEALHVLVVVPLYAPAPNVIGWFGLAFPIDTAFAQRLKTTSQVEVTFVSTAAAGGPRVLASTLPSEAALSVARLAGSSSTSGAQMVDLPGDRYVTLFKTQAAAENRDIVIVLQRALSTELAGARELEGQILAISLIALALGALVAFWIARGVSNPVLQLAAHTRHVAAGDYTRRLDLNRADELGTLAAAFNDMSTGLAERDRVRDLLDKNVSPEIAAQLMRDGALLGGEEREVTILFADLRGFTSMSENLRPQELLALLNRYLDRMSAEIERHGGVIDKFVGDAIMALFGAPVAQSRAAEQAIAAALGMERALAQFNAELAEEGKAPLGMGIGVNTARVVAGNIGSHRRLNYSVIGDGVNVASRLQSETRKTEFRTNIITSAATAAALGQGQFTLRALGAVQVKGRAEPVEIFAVDGNGNTA
jgi:adenylate cyclase